jgi:hypothetical protein
MKNLFLILVLISRICYAQQKTNQVLWHLIVVDENSLQGIGNATITINKKRQVVTGINGLISIDKASIRINDAIAISSIGYQSKLVTVGPDYNYPDTIKLRASVTSLQEVAIISTNVKGMSIGIIKEKYITEWVPNPQMECLQYIPNSESLIGKIETIAYVLSDKLHGIDQPFKVNVYTKSANSIYPDKQLIKDSLIVYNPEKKHNVSVDISKYDIQLPPNGIIVSFETLTPNFYGKDSVWYYGRQGKRWFLKMPAIGLGFKNKNDFGHDIYKLDSQEPYCFVSSTRNLGYEIWSWDLEERKFRSYKFNGCNFAISITLASK